MGSQRDCFCSCAAQLKYMVGPSDTMHSWPDNADECPFSIQVRGKLQYEAARVCAWFPPYSRSDNAANLLPLFVAGLRPSHEGHALHHNIRRPRRPASMLNFCKALLATVHTFPGLGTSRDSSGQTCAEVSTAGTAGGYSLVSPRQRLCSIEHHDHTGMKQCKPWVLGDDNHASLLLAAGVSMQGTTNGCGCSHARAATAVCRGDAG